MRYLISLLLFMTSSAAIAAAAAPAGPGSDLFADNPTDLAHKLLGMIFGGVPGVLETTGALGTSGVGDIIGIFNWGCLIIASGIGGYAVIRAIMDTAHQGEVFGRSISTTWYPIRGGLAVAAVLPVAKGYSIAQVFVLWAALQGSNFANLLFDGTIASLESGHLVSSPASADGTQVVYGALRSEVCAAAINKSILAGAGQAATLVVARELPYDKSDVNGWAWGSSNLDLGADVCGRLTWPKFDGTQYSDDNERIAMRAIYSSHYYAVRDLLPEIRKVADMVMANKRQEVQQAMGQLLTAYQDRIRHDTAEQVMAMSGEGPLAAAREAMRQDGWVAAGLWYYRLAGLNSRIQHAVTDGTPQVTAFKPADQLPLLLTEEVRGYLAFSDSIVGHDPATGLSKTYGAGAIEEADAADGFVGMLQKALSIPAKKAVEAVTKMHPDQHPIIAMKESGDYLIGLAWGCVVAATAVMALIGTASLGAAGVLIPIALAVIISLGAAGILAGVYVPLLPAIFSVVGIYGFLTSTVVTLCAMPVWSVAAMVPDGHEVHGQMANFGMVLKVLLFPSLIVAGMVFSFSTIAAIGWLVNQSMPMLLSGLSVNSTSGLVTGLVVIVIWASAMRTLTLNSVRYFMVELPDHLVAFVGANVGRTDTSPVDEIGHDVKGHVDKGSHAAEGGMGSAFGSKDKGGGGDTGGTLDINQDEHNTGNMPTPLPINDKDGG